MILPVRIEVITPELLEKFKASGEWIKEAYEDPETMDYSLGKNVVSTGFRWVRYSSETQGWVKPGGYATTEPKFFNPDRTIPDPSQAVEVFEKLTDAGMNQSLDNRPDVANNKVILTGRELVTALVNAATKGDPSHSYAGAFYHALRYGIEVTEEKVYPIIEVTDPVTGLCRQDSRVTKIELRRDKFPEGTKVGVYVIPEVQNG